MIGGIELIASNQYRFSRVLKNLNVCICHNYRMPELCLVCKKNKWNSTQFKSQTKTVMFYLGCWGLSVLTLKMSLISAYD